MNEMFKYDYINFIKEKDWRIYKRMMERKYLDDDDKYKDVKYKSFTQC
jgi:hypothetical protein